MQGEQYWALVVRCARAVEADGCSGVPDFYRECCDAHDVAYRTGANALGAPRTQRDADRELRECIQARSPWGNWSPMAWWRWVVLRLVGSRAYHPRLAPCPELLARKEELT